MSEQPNDTDLPLPRDPPVDPPVDRHVDRPVDRHVPPVPPAPGTIDLVAQAAAETAAINAVNAANDANAAAISAVQAAETAAETAIQAANDARTAAINAAYNDAAAAYTTAINARDNAVQAAAAARNNAVQAAINDYNSGNLDETAYQAAVQAAETAAETAIQAANDARTAAINAANTAVQAAFGTAIPLYVATSYGSDTEGDGTLVKPLATISKGIMMSDANKVIFVAPGIYNENILVNKFVYIIGTNNTIIKPNNIGIPIIQITNGATGTTIKNLKVIGSFTDTSVALNNSDNPKSGILFFDNVEPVPIDNVVLENLEIQDASNGIAFNNKYSNNIHVKGCKIHLNRGVGIRIASNTLNMNGFTVDNSIISDNNLNAISSNPSGEKRLGFTNFNILNSTISNNNLLRINNSHDVSLFGFNGNLIISHTIINCNHILGNNTNGGWALVIFGTGTGTVALPYMPSGNIRLSNLTIKGQVIKSVLGIARFSSFGTISMNDVDIKDCLPNIANQAWLQLAIQNPDNNTPFPLGNTKLRTIYTTANGDVDARLAQFYSNSDNRLLNVAHDLLEIKNQIYDKTQKIGIGEVIIVNGATIIGPTGVDSVVAALNGVNKTIILGSGDFTLNNKLSSNDPKIITAISKSVKMLFVSKTT